MFILFVIAIRYPRAMNAPGCKNKHQDAVSFNELITHDRTAAKDLPHRTQNAQRQCESQPHPGTVDK